MSSLVKVQLTASPAPSVSVLPLSALPPLPVTAQVIGVAAGR